MKIINYFCAGFNAPEAGSLEEDAYTPAASTSFSAFISAREYLVAERAEQRWVPMIVHDDAEVLMDVLLDGTGLGGTVVAVEPTVLAGKTTTAWKVKLSPRSGKYFKGKLQDKLVPYGTPGREVEVTHLQFDDGEWTIELTWDTKSDSVKISDFEAQAKNAQWLNRKVAFVPGYLEFMYQMAMSALRSAKGGANAWMFGADSDLEGDADDQD